MKILITGAGGFVGQALAERLLNDSHSVTLVDIFEPPIPPKTNHPELATSLKADLSTDSTSILKPDLDTIYIFHGIMSAGSEADFSLGWRVNLHSTLSLLDAIRTTCRPGTRVIYASSTAIYGQPLPPLPDENTLPAPRSSYGAQKSMVEYAINDYTRKGYINGFALRFPTISVRPGKPTAAASSWMSGIIREPLQGKASSLPCEDEFEAWLCSPRTLVENLVRAGSMETDVLPSHRRQVNLPGITVNVGEMLEALRKAGGEEAVGLVKREKATKEIRDMLDSWPIRFDTKLAASIGFVQDQDFRGAVMDFKKSLSS